VTDLLAAIFVAFNYEKWTKVDALPLNKSGKSDHN